MFGDIKVDEVTDVEVFKSTYFADGFDAENAGLTVSSTLIIHSFYLLTVKLNPFILELFVSSFEH